jgi:hypothetical protein
MLSVVGAFVGVLIVLATTGSVAWTLVIPRGRLGVTRYVDKAVDTVYVKLGRCVKSYERRDRVLASEAVMVLGVLLGYWLASYLIAYALILWPIEHHFGSALRESGSSLFTLGFAGRATPGSSLVDFLAAATGMIMVALQIAYLPTLYSSYNRRETEITLLATRAGIPAWGPEILARYSMSHSLPVAAIFYETWERWAADVAESHSSYPSLMRFRSPKSHSSWLIGLLAVLDSAALFLASAPGLAPFQARLCIQMGFNCFRTLGATVGIPVDPDPLPSDPIALSYSEFLEGWQRLVDAGFPVERTPEDAWPQFRGWRVNYEHVAYRLAFALDAVPAAWSGPRRFGSDAIRPRAVINRTPENPVQGERPVF